MRRPPTGSSASSPGAPTRTTGTWACCGTCCRCSRAPAAAPSSPSTSSTGCARCCGPTRVGLFITDDAGPRLLVGQQRAATAAPVPLGAADVSEAERALMAEAVASGEVRPGRRWCSTRRRRTAAANCSASPCRSSPADACSACSSLVGTPEALDLDKTDLPVLTGVAAQLAVALDREHLAELHRVRAEHERRRLQAEVQDLRSALQQQPVRVPVDRR